MPYRHGGRFIAALVAVCSLLALSVFVSAPAAVAADAPGAPTAVRVTGRGVYGVDVRWAAPSSDGGSPVTAYSVTATPGGATVATDGQTYLATFVGLDDTTAYTFTASASNASGSSVASAPTDRVTPLPKAGTLQPITPVRALDTRIGIGSSGPVNPGEYRVVHVPVPNYAVSALVNVTAVAPTAEGYLTLYAAGTAQPWASSLNFAAGATVPNLVAVPVSSGGDIVVYNANGRTEVIVDVLGYHAAGAGAGFAPVTPTRIYDSRQPSGPLFWPGGMVSVTMPSNVTPQQPLYLNVTVTNAPTSSYVTAYDCSTTPPTSNLNVTPGSTAANAVVVASNLNRMVCFRMPAARGDLIVDLVGVAGGVTSYFPQVPSRVFDSRTGTGGPAGRIGPGQTVEVGFPTFEALTQAVTLNLTGVNASQPTYFTVYPCGTPRPGVSNLNLIPGRTSANQVNVEVGAGHRVCIYNNAGFTDAIVDLSGYHLAYSG